ncbi:MAG: formylglycine-generating enzyme family protein [Nitrospirae bacterium]|nr:formylglycine-generating enzyme family protein [Nitrospirota bacterium]
MWRRMKRTVLTIMLIAAGIAAGAARSAQAAEYQMIPGLSAQDRIVLAKGLVEQGQCRDGLIEITEAMKELPNDETLVRLKAVCEVDLMRPGAKDTVLKWLKLAPQGHPERDKMLALLAKSQGASETPVEWVLVPAGEFEMGTEGGPATPDEGPKHKVTLDAFYIGKYEVSNRQYRAFVKVTGRRVPENCCDARYNLWRGDVMIDGVGELPAVNVNWDDAAAYCKWSGARLPTEAEWEKAARGTDGRAFPWGNDPPSGSRANYSFDEVSPPWTGPGMLSRVDQFENGKSPYGVHQMAGNVWEWVQDWYDENYYKSSQAKNPTGPAEGQARVIRGGSWRNSWDVIRVTNRNKHLPDERRVYIGIRCAKDGK